MNVPFILRSLSISQAEAVMASYREAGIHPSSLTQRVANTLQERGFLRLDGEGFLVVAPVIEQGLQKLERVR